MPSLGGQQVPTSCQPLCQEPAGCPGQAPCLQPATGRGARWFGTAMEKASATCGAPRSGQSPGSLAKMPLHSARAAALLTWVNSTKVCPDPLDDLSQLQDCSIFIRIINKIHRSEEGESVLEQPLPERISFIRGFLQKHCKHKSATENLVSAQKLLEGEELALAKVAVLLLYHTSMSCKSPREWYEFDYKTQVELASILKFVLDNEESLNENLETFLQRKAPPSSSSASSSSSEEHSPLLSLPHKREVRFLELQKIASSSSSSSSSSSGTNNTLSGSPSSPMGDVMQTPQFQLRRLKKQLAVERENRDELEVELAENRKLITEKEAQITMMQQRIDRLALLNEKQAADQLEPKEMEELREKNESLMVRLHEALKQCQDLKTEKGQMDRKINQLSEENGDLSFKLREIASHLVQLQEALNELSEEHNAALAQSQEKQGQLESELRAALQEKKCSEEKIEILQGKISLLEDQLAKLGDCSAQEKGEVMGDILKLEELKQEVSSLAAKGAELQATVLRLEEEKQLREAALQSERGRFEEEKQQLGSLVAGLQNSLSESHRARERLEQDLRAREAGEPQGTPLQGQGAEAEARSEGEAGRLAALSAQHEKTLQERDSALQQLQHLQEANASLSSQLQAMAQAQDASQEEKAELSRKVGELEARILELGAQRQQGAAEGLKAQLRELEGRLKESQQRLAERERLARENTRLQERLLFLEESLRNTEGILEDEKRRAAESLEGSLARIAELEAERQQLAQGREPSLQERGEEPTKRRVLEESREKPTGASPAAKAEDGERGRLEEEMRALSREHGRTCQRLQAEQEKAAALEARAERLAAEHQERLAVLQADLSSARARAKEKEGEEQKLRAEVSSLREKIAVTEQATAQRVAGLEADARRAAEALEGVSQQLSQEKLKSKELEAAVERLRSTEAELSRVAAAGRQRELELEAEVKKLSGELTVLGTRLEEMLREHRRDLAHREEEAECLRQEVERAKADCAAERARKAELEVQLQNSLNEQRVERSVHREELARSRELMEEKEGELDELRRKNVLRGEELRDLQKTVSKLKGELASAEAAKERAPMADNELQGFSEATRSRDAEGDSVKATCSKEMSLKSLEEKTRHRDQESGSSQDLYQEKLKETQALRLQVEELEQKCREQQEAMATLERAAAEAAIAEQAELEALRREAAQQKEKASELQKLLEASRSAQALHNSTVEALRKELQEKGRELIQSKTAITAAEKELASLRSAAQEKGRSEESWKEQVSQCVQEMERKNSLIGSLEHEVSILHRQVTEKEGESKELKRLIVAESEKSKKLEERLRVLQTEMATAASRAAERCSLMKVEVQRCQEEMEKQRLAIEALKRDRHCQSEREDELRQEVKVCQDKCLQKEQLLAALQQELGSAQALAGELPALKHLCQQLQAERASLESQHRQDLEQRAKALAALQAELARAKLEAAEVPSLRERSAEQDRAIQRLQAETAEQAARLAGLQQANARLAEENRGLGESRSRGQQRLEAELGQAVERHARELERLRSASEELVAGSRREAEEAVRKLEAMSNEYESSKAAALEERRKLLEERQRLTAQVEQLEVFRKEQAKQVEELNKKLTQHEKTTRTQQQRVKVLEGELQAETTRQQEKVAELQAQLAQKEQAAEHYKGQMEKAKTYYDAKKQQNQDLTEKLKAMEQLQKENTELRNESERLAKELQQSILQAKESELSCRNLTSQVRSLEAQVEFADRQLRELGKFQVATDTLKGRETFRQNPADLSADSLDLSLDEAQPLNSTRKPGRSQSEASAVPPGSEESPVSRRLPRKVESLESLYFTPIPSRTQSQLESSAGSLGDLSLDSGCKTRSARRRTTINITMTKKQAKTEEPDSANVSFCSIPAARPPNATPGKGRLRSATSTRSLASFPSQDSLVKLETSSPQETPGNSALLGLPGYRPVTRSSLRRLQGGSSSSLGRSSIYLGTCQDEPEQLDDWNRIAELQQRNRACPPHLKTCYPLESRPSDSLGTITDEEMKTGDPKETLRRASMQPSQIAAGTAARRNTLGTVWAGGITTRQQRKRLSDESHQGPDTPESKKPTSCFPRPQTPRDRSERRSSQVSRRSEQQAPSKQAERRQSMAFSILNTPKKLGNSLLRRAAGRKTTTKNSPRGSARRSPRIATAKSPKGKASRRSLKDTKF
ncbi:PREDICTED: nuclear mitotic apparatus protein 1 isoform X2 [Haliaeetus leucocephalus]|uniref:nuclear mitotic apparatus protein 1 isoform X2 n=1 Tax=Haliaeetus leucocephalus TaxID=52644 RepID=UPI00053CCF30|nr:PREDICTED: nuclear mitotic apparatus protein 1 isoform X2 [Haliaeetus leucocephalus]